MYIYAVFVEKILRVQPNVKKLYLLLRAADTEAALQRFNTEVPTTMLLTLNQINFILIIFLCI